MNYIFYGDEDYLIKAKIKEIEKTLFHDNVYSRFDYDALEMDIETIIDDACTLPLFDEAKMIVVDNAYYFMSSNIKKKRDSEDKAKEKATIENKLIIDYLKNYNESTTLIFVCHGNIDTKKKIVKEALELCKHEEFKALNDDDFRTYVVKFLKKNKLDYNEALLNKIINYLPDDLQSVNNELDKLALYGNPLTEDIIERLLVKPLEDNTLKLTNAVLNRNYEEALLIWKDFMKLNIEPLMVIASLATQIRFCFQMLHLMNSGYDDNEIASILKCKSGRIYNTKNSIRGRSTNDFLKLLEALNEVDENIKLHGVNNKVAFENFLINLK